MITDPPITIQVDSTDPFGRGLQRGRAIRDVLAESLSIYLALFATAGISPETVQLNAELALRATREWCMDLASEMEGTAEGSGLAVWQVAALNARTEILSGGLGAKPGECSTIVNARNNPIGAQTWDWHDELSDHWHLQEVRGNARDFVGLTEYGIISKIGINDAGVGILLNILGHRADRADGVPVHLVGARVLAQASTLAEAVDILLSAPVSTSSAITVVSPEGAVIVELSPVGAAVVQPQNDVLLHTNHFLDDRLAQGEKPGLYDPDSQLRLATLTDRVRLSPLPPDASGLLPFLVSQPGDPAQLCCVPADGAVLGDRWATLATITLDSAARGMTVSAGSPADTIDTETVRLVAEHRTGGVGR
ncbi:penicillin acyltransferase [Cryobacterium sp. TMT1-21]|nr:MULTISPECIES: C45 family peptidase [Cryobacterium]TFD17928.1 penicillin acyltransferase [Cryobacterium sp. TMT1-21]TFD18923.1 penicillin acyltransferase [Cryobacterium sp. TMT2-23]TFD20955.1 penicillin acyltransferase [Cryobacterium sp. TMT4-10]